MGVNVYSQVCNYPTILSLFKSITVYPTYILQIIVYATSFPPIERSAEEGWRLIHVTWVYAKATQIVYAKALSCQYFQSLLLTLSPLQLHIHHYVSPAMTPFCLHNLVQITKDLFSLPALFHLKVSHGNLRRAKFGKVKLKLKKKKKKREKIAIFLDNWA